MGRILRVPELCSYDSSRKRKAYTKAAPIPQLGRDLLSGPGHWVVSKHQNRNSRAQVETLLRQRMRSLKSVSFQLPCERMRCQAPLRTSPSACSGSWPSCCRATSWTATTRCSAPCVFWSSTGTATCTRYPHRVLQTAKTKKIRTSGGTSRTQTPAARLNVLTVNLSNTSKIPREARSPERFSPVGHAPVKFSSRPCLQEADEILNPSRRAPCLTGYSQSPKIRHRRSTDPSLVRKFSQNSHTNNRLQRRRSGTSLSVHSEMIESGSCPERLLVLHASRVPTVVITCTSSATTRPIANMTRFVNHGPQLSAAQIAREGIA